MKRIMVTILLQFLAIQLMAEDAVVRAPWNQLEIGPELFLYNYEEPNLMELDGMLYGLETRFSRYIPRTKAITVGKGEDAVVTQREYMIVLRLDGRYAMGQHDYDGALQDGTPYKIASVDATSYELRGLFGHTAWMRPDRSTILFAGLGSRFKDDDSSFDEAGYRRESSYLYVPLLIEHTRTMQNGRTLGFSFEYNLFLSGEQVSHLPIGDRIVEIKNKQSAGNGYRISVSYAGATASGIEWKIEPFFRYWDIDDSDIHRMRIGLFTISFIEPANTTQEIGVGARIIF